jgi:hypothetical protein
LGVCQQAEAQDEEPHLAIAAHEELSGATRRERSGHTSHLMCSDSEAGVLKKTLKKNLHDLRGHFAEPR